MRILHVIPTLAPRAGGPSKFCKEISISQSSIGNDVTICTSNRNHPPKLKLSEKEINRILGYNSINIMFFKSFTPYLFSFTMFFWLIKNLQTFDIIHIHGLYRFPVTFSAILARIKGKKYIIRPHGSLDPFLYKQSKYNIFIKRIHEFLFDKPNLNNASAIHYTSESEKTLAEFMNLKSKCFVIPIGLSLNKYRDLNKYGEFRTKIGIPLNIPLILFLGRINFKKGLDLLLKAFSIYIIKNPSTILTIVGPDNDGYLKNVKNWIFEYNIQKNVIYLDHLEEIEVIKAYRDSNLFVLTSYSENFGMTVIEAMACGTPVLISDKVNIWREIKDSGGGFVTNLNIEQIVTNLENALFDLNKLKEMGKIARRFVFANYDINVVSERLVEQYQRIVLND